MAPVRRTQTGPERQSRSRQGGFEGLVLLGLLLQQGWLLPLSESSARALGFVVVLVAAGGLRLFWPLWPGAALAVLAAILHRFAPEPARFSHLVINLALLSVLAYRQQRPRTALACAGGALTAWAALEHAVPGCVVPLTRLAHTLADGVSGLLGTPPNLGPTYLGLIPMTVLGVYVGAAFAASGRRWLGPAVAAAFAVLWAFAACALNAQITNLAVWVRFNLPIAVAGHGHHTHTDPWMMGLTPLVLSLASVLALAWALREAPSSQPISSWSRTAKVVHVGLVGLAGLAVGLRWLGEMGSPQPPRDIVLYEKGLLDWRVPKPEGPFGVGRSGMFGQFDLLLERSGRVRTKTMTLDALPAHGSQLDKGVLVLINPTEVSEADAERIEAFVRGGGGLLVLGDHTDMEGIAGPLNRALGFAGASFRFDSAFPARRTWRNVYRRTSHPLARGLGSSNETFQQGTGASLALEGAAWEPVVLGQYVFSDLGNRLKPEDGFLGDYAYQPGELLGDLVVVAVRQVGAGRVAVFGDTSAFQNLAVPRAAEWIVRVLQYLERNPGGWSKAAPWLAAPAIVLLLLSSRRWSALLVFSAAALVGLAATDLSRPDRAESPLPADERTALIDASHFNAFTLEHFKVNSVDGLFNTLMRNGYWPAAIAPPRQFHESEAGLYVLIAPTVPLREGEIDALLARIADGATLIVTTGYEESPGVERLLERLEIEIGPDPLGPIPLAPRLDDPAAFQQVRDAPHFTEAWPLSWKGGAWQSFYEWKGFHVVAARRWGAGRVILIGDTRFLLDETLETESDYWPGNIRFFQAMLATWPPEERAAGAGEEAK